MLPVAGGLPAVSGYGVHVSGGSDRVSGRPDVPSPFRTGGTRCPLESQACAVG
jgi:hypothetical protein